MAEMSLAMGYLQREKYGAVELKQVYQRYFSIAMGIAVFIHAIIIGGYYLVEILNQEEPPARMVHIMKYTDLGPPPSIQTANIPPPVSVSAPVAKPTVGAPVPVPDAIARIWAAHFSFRPFNRRLCFPPTDSATSPAPCGVPAKAAG